MLSEFPNLTFSEFHHACLDLETRFNVHGRTQHDWISVEVVQSFNGEFLKVTKELINDANIDAGEDEISEDDDEAFETHAQQKAVIHYDILFSLTYRVPVLYISIVDPYHRYPPTMTTLSEHLIPLPFTAEARHVGIIGGITVADHPVTSRPTFFIHPCQTAEVMRATVGKKEITAEEYLMIWVGALGRYVGLSIPLPLVQQHVLQVEDKKTP